MARVIRFSYVFFTFFVIKKRRSQKNVRILYLNVENMACLLLKCLKLNEKKKRIPVDNPK